MKANNGSGNNESRDSWETPQWLFEELDNFWKKFFICAHILVCFLFITFLVINLIKNIH